MTDDRGSTRMGPEERSASFPADTATKKVVTGDRLHHLGQALKLVALLLFLLPWVTVSCADQTLVELSGLDLARGSVKVTNPLTGELFSPARSGESHILVLVAAILVAATLIAGFLLKRRLAAILSIAGLAAASGSILYALIVRLPDRAREDATAGSAEGISESQIADLINVDLEWGFWLTLTSMISALLTSGLYLAWTATRAR